MAKVAKKTKVSELVANEDYLLSQKKRDKALNALREKLEPRLNPYPVRLFSAERHKFLDRFIKSYRTHEPADVDPNLILAFFNCLLNGGITDFNLENRKEYRQHPFQVVIDPLKLLPIISQRCNNLQSLSLSFGVQRMFELEGRVIVPFSL